MLANYIIDKTNELKFNIPNKDLSRNDDKNLRDLLQKLTNVQRKKLWINKSTFWYIQQNIKKGKKIKVYEKVRLKSNFY
jgi:ribosomal protein S13